MPRQRSDTPFLTAGLDVLDTLLPSALRRLLIELPTERAIAIGRLTLAITCVAAVAISPPADMGAQRAVTIVLLVYLLFSAALAALPRLPGETWFHVLQQAIDIVATSALIVFSDVSTNPYFILFVFSLVVGLLRWNWRGALVTAVALTGVLMLLPSRFLVTPQGMRIMDEDLSRGIVRGGFLLVCGAMLAYLGAHRERSRRRFAQLAEWPSGGLPDDSPEALAPFLAHAAMVLQAPRVLLIWEEQDEPTQNALLWSNGLVEHQAGGPDAFAALSPDDDPDVSFCGPDQAARRAAAPDRYVLDPALQQRFAVRTAATAPIGGELCTGRVYLLDRPTWIEEDAPIVKIIAQRLGTELEERILRRQLQDGATSRERVRLGRDLHDGVLQGLAAASMQIKALSLRLPGEAAASLQAIREIIGNESHRIRGFVEESRTAPQRSAALLDAADELKQRASAMRAQWGCAVDVTVDPPGLALDPSTAHHLGYLVGEGISNAVRHGGASRVTLELSRAESGLQLRIRDDGSGFETAREVGRARAVSTRPRSLRSRVEEIGGRLWVESSAVGADIRIELPT